MNNGQYTLKRISNLEEYAPGTSLLQLFFNNYDDEEVYMFGNYNEVLQYLDQDVIVEFRDEIVRGAIKQVVANLANITNVTTLSQEENIKLYIDADLELGTANINFNDLRVGDVVDKAIMYCLDHKFESSHRATWATLTVLDKKRNVRKLRVFDPDRDTVELKGNFIKCAVRVSSYGLQTQDAYIHSEGTVEANPLVAIAQKVVVSITSKDGLLTDFMNSKNILSKMVSYDLEEGVETGFMLVRLAVELVMLQQAANVSKHLDPQLLTRMAVCEKSYVTTNKPEATLSKSIQNIIIISQHQLAKDKALVSTLDSDSNLKLAEVAFYKGVKQSADVVVSLYGLNEYETLEQFLKGAN